MISATRQAIFHLSEEDRRELYDSGINDTTIGRYAPYTEHSAATISRLLNRHRPYDEDSNGALVYPVCDSNGQSYSDFVQVKLHVPRRSLDGKVIKYEIPAGRGYRIGFSPDTVRTHDLCTPLFIVEGIKKGMIVDQMGYGVAILLGIDCWSEPGIESRPLYFKRRGIGRFRMTGTARSLRT